MFSVLIVEDDPMVAMINEQYVLMNSKFSVAGSVRNGQAALDFLETQTVDLIIMDVFMPYMDGVETLKKIRERKINSDVIMVTAANDSATLEQTMYAGVVDYLIKPFAKERFQIALEKFELKSKTLKSTETFDQSRVDSLISGGSKSKPAAGYPKGIQEKTLNLVRGYFKTEKEWLSGDIIAEKLGLSIVTVRHYLGFLVEQGEIQESINYETGGRPSNLYKVKN